MNSLRATQKGFTLIEIITTVVLLGILATSVGGALISTMRIYAQANTISSLSPQIAPAIAIISDKFQDREYLGETTDRSEYRENPGSLRNKIYEMLKKDGKYLILNKGNEKTTLLAIDSEPAFHCPSSGPDFEMCCITISVANHLYDFYVYRRKKPESTP